MDQPQAVSSGDGLGDLLPVVVGDTVGHDGCSVRPDAGDLCRGDSAGTTIVARRSGCTGGACERLSVVSRAVSDNTFDGRFSLDKAEHRIERASGFERPRDLQQLGLDHQSRSEVGREQWRPANVAPYACRRSLDLREMLIHPRDL